MLGQTVEEKIAAAHELDQAMNRQMNNRAVTYAQDGKTALEKKQWDIAIDNYTQAITWDPNNTDARNGLRQAQDVKKAQLVVDLKEEILRDIQARQWIDAAASLRELQKLTPDDEWMKDELKEVVLLLKPDATAVGKQREDALFERGSQNYINGNYESALADWQKILASNPNRPLIQEYVAKAKNKVLEEKLHARGLDSNTTKKTADSMARAAYTYYSIGKTDEAISLWEKVLALDPDNADAQAALKRAKARRTLPKTDDQSDPQRQAEDLNRQALKEYSTDQREAAMALWRKALLIDPGNIRVKNNIQRVESEMATDENAH
jgi:tetratricopeptide (TPR) repeat protein